MGNPRGFMTVDRQTYSERDPVERIGDWNEFHLDLPIVELQDQGSRCMDCGVPFCHTADLMANTKNVVNGQCLYSLKHVLVKVHL